MVRNLCPYTGLASSARPCGILGILADLWVSYFHMDELYSTTSSVYQEPKSVNIENRVFFFLAVLAPCFQERSIFHGCGHGTLVYLSMEDDHGVVMVFLKQPLAA